MVTLHVTISKVAVAILEVEAADLADKAPVFLQRKALCSLHERAIPFAGAVGAEEDFALREFIFFILRRGNRLLGRPVIYSGPDRAGRLRQSGAVICELFPYLLLQESASQETGPLVGRIESEEIAQLHLDAVWISEAGSIRPVRMDWEGVQELTQRADGWVILADVRRIVTDV